MYNVKQKVNLAKRKIYFNEEHHKYTDDLGNVYTSTTTFLSNYYNEFDQRAVAKRCIRKRDSMYYGWSVEQVLDYWAKVNKEACDDGNEKHNYLEHAIKSANGYKRSAGGVYINDRIYTIPDIMSNHNYGRLNIDYFIQTGVKDKYPKIFAAIQMLVDKGFRIYAEIGTYSYDHIISGLIDVLFVTDNGEFVILDWKTNKHKLMFQSGYFKKDKNGKETGEFKVNNNKMKPPLNHLPDSHGHQYTMQLSTYAYLTERFGLKCVLIVLYHIRKEIDKNGLEVVDDYKIDYLKNEASLAVNHFYRQHANSRKRQTNLFD
jgi:hypothetical protein